MNEQLPPVVTALGSHRGWTVTDEFTPGLGTAALCLPSPGFKKSPCGCTRQLKTQVASLSAELEKPQKETHRLAALLI